MNKSLRNHTIIILILSVLISGFFFLKSVEANEPKKKNSNKIDEHSVLLEKFDAIEKKVLKLEQEGKLTKENKPKDIWDKISSTGGLITGILVALIGAFATYIFNKQQRTSEAKKNARELSILEIQTVQSFIPHLTSGDSSSIKAALYAIESLGNKELTTKLATLFGGPGALEALFTISEQRDGEAKESSNIAIGKILNTYKQSVVQILRNGVKSTVDPEKWGQVYC